MVERLQIWLGYPVAVVERLTTPRPDVGRSDAVVARLLKGSGLSRLVAAVAVPLARAKEDAHVVRWWLNLRGVWLATSGADRNRLVALFMICLGTTAAAGVVVRPLGPLSWILPSSIIVIGALVWLAADPLARAMAARRS
jgi:hypothetical protein